MITRKRVVSLFIMVCMCIVITACGNTKAENSSNTGSTAESEVSNQAEVNQTETEETKIETEEVIEEAKIEDSSNTSNTLVIYFSATGNTKAVAENIANGLSTDIYEIAAEEPYTDADLDYGDNNSRSTVEMNDPSVRPAISGSVDNMDQYDKVYIGYPIWWGEAPRILSTFVESYDFTDKTVIPFCTSASSGIGSSATRLAEVAGTGNWLDGQRFSGSESQDEVMEWINGL